MPTNKISEAITSSIIMKTLIDQIYIKIIRIELRKSSHEKLQRINHIYTMQFINYYYIFITQILVKFVIQINSTSLNYFHLKLLTQVSKNKLTFHHDRINCLKLVLINNLDINILASILANFRMSECESMILNRVNILPTIK